MLTLNAFDSFVSRLWAHDWTYMMSDDPTVFRKGAAEFVALSKLMKLDDRARKAFRAVRSTAGLPYTPAPTLTVEAAKDIIDGLRKSF